MWRICFLIFALSFMRATPLEAACVDFFHPYDRIEGIDKILVSIRTDNKSIEEAFPFPSFYLFTAEDIVIKKIQNLFVNESWLKIAGQGMEAHSGMDDKAIYFLFNITTRREKLFEKEFVVGVLSLSLGRFSYTPKMRSLEIFQRTPRYYPFIASKDAVNFQQQLENGVSALTSWMPSQLAIANRHSNKSCDEITLQ